MNRQQLVNAILAVIVIAGLAIAGVVGYYYVYQPDKTLTLSKENSDKMWALLKEANYVSPNYPNASDPNRTIYMLTYKGCKECRDYEASEFPKFKRAGIDTRVYAFSPNSGQGAADNAAIVEIWLNRDWKLYEAWIKDPLWKGDGAPPTDMARRYVLRATQDFYGEARALIPAKTPSDVHAPIVMWATKDNLIKICFCDNAKPYQLVRNDFGITEGSVFTIPNINLPESLGGSSSSSASSAKPAASASSSSADGEHSTDFGPDT